MAYQDDLRPEADGTNVVEYRRPFLARAQPRPGVVFFNSGYVCRRADARNFLASYRGFLRVSSRRPDWLTRDLRGGRYLRRVRQLLSRGRAPRGGDRFGPA